MSSSTIRVLLIDDEESDYLMTRTLLGRIDGADHEVDWASSYAEGLARLNECRHDVCLLDYFLDEGTGLDLLLEIRSQAIRTPVIFLTGKGNREVDLDAMRSGAVDYLVKGSNDPEALERSLRYAVERHRAQEELRRSEARHRAMFEHLPLGLYRVTLEGVYIEANPALIRTLDFPERDTVLQERARDFFVSPQHREEFVRTLAEQGVIAGFESRIRTATGRPIRIRNSARMHRSAGGLVEYVEGTVEDVTSSHTPEQVERDAAAFRALRTATHIGVLLVGPNGQVLDANRAALALLGTNERRIGEHPLWDLFDPSDGAMLAARLEEVARDAAETGAFEMGVRSADGSLLRRRTTLASVPFGNADRSPVLVLLEEVEFASNAPDR